MVQITLRSIDTRSVQMFAKDVSKFPRINGERARLLATYAHKGSVSARNELCHSSLWYVIHLALKVQSQLYNSSFEELVQYGNLGLLQAIDAYHPNSKCGFLTFAGIYIENAMKRGFSNDFRTVQQPAYVTALLNKLDKAANRFYAENGYEATADDLADMTGIDYKQVEEIQKHRVTGFVEMGNTETYAPCVDIIGEHEDWDAIAYRVNQMLNDLSAREQYILVKRYGINCEAMSIQQIADTLGLSFERVRQILVKIETTMRQKYAA